MASANPPTGIVTAKERTNGLANEIQILAQRIKNESVVPKVNPPALASEILVKLVEIERKARVIQEINKSQWR